MLMSTRSSAARLARDGGGRLRSPRGCRPFSAAKGTPCSSGPGASVPTSALGGLSGASTQPVHTEIPFRIPSVACRCPDVR